MDNTQTFDAIVLGGGEGVSIDPSQPIKGLVEIAGKPMVQWVVEALQEASSVNDIIVVLPSGAQVGSWASDVRIVHSDGTILENGRKGFEAASGTRPLLGVTGDIPALTASAIDDFTRQVQARRAQFAYPLIYEKDVQNQFPGSTRTYVKLREGKVTGGNIIACTMEAARTLEPLMDDFSALRKDPQKAVKLVGANIATKYALGSLSVSDVENRIYKMFNIRGAGIFTPYAEIGVDVDKPSDKTIVETALRGRTQST